MIIGVPKEIKIHEYRVGMTPASVAEAVVHGHGVLVEAGAGAGIGCSDAEYVAAGAGIVADSIPAKEYDETINKARALIKAIEIAERGI